MRHVVSVFAAAIAASATPAGAEPVVVQLPGATLNGDSARWGEWIADVERPAAAARVNKVDSFTIKQKVVEDSASKDVVLKGSTIGQNATVAPGVTIRPREEKVDLIAVNHSIKSPRNSASGQASGKRGHEPLTPTNGSIIIYLREPWSACAQGDRFNGAYLVVGTTHKYRLDGLQVARCSADQIALTYATVQPE